MKGLETEELITALSSALDIVGVADVIEPETIRPVALQARDRRDLGEVEKQFQKSLDEIKRDERIPELVFRLANLHLSEGTFAEQSFSMK